MTYATFIISDAALFQHPEARSGEVFLTNCDSDEPDEFDDISYQTKRAGDNAYDAEGNILTRMFPVFVGKAEYNVTHREIKIGH